VELLPFNELQIDRNEQKLLEELLYNLPFESSVPYMLGLAEFLTKSIPIISSSMELLFGRFSKTPIVTESVDVIPIRHRNSHIPYTGSTTLSLLMLLLYFTLFGYLESLGRGDSCLVHSAKY